MTEFNTAQNRRISMLGISDDALKTKRKRTRGIHFNEDEQIINPEDIDPSVGRFRNLIRTTVIPNKVHLILKVQLLFYWCTYFIMFDRNSKILWVSLLTNIMQIVRINIT